MRRTIFVLVLSFIATLPLRADLMRDVSLRERLLEGSHPGAHLKMRAVESPDRSGRIAAQSTSTFNGFVHCPAEFGQQCTNPFGSVAMVDNTAFYRDVLVGALTTVSNPSNGETWSAVFTDPNGAARNFPGFTFYTSYNGLSNCFVSPFQYICGVTGIQILWYTQSQCAPTGTWKAQFTNTTIPIQTFELKPQLDADLWLPLQLQTTFQNVPSGNPAAPYTSAPNPYDETCRRNIFRDRTVLYCPLSQPVPTGFVRWSIAAKGCYMTNVAMIMTYHNFAVNPKVLNDILVTIRDAKDNPLGFNKAGDVRPENAANYVRQHGKNISYPIPGTGSLSRDICTYGPQLVRVPVTIREQHWVTAYGVQKDGTVLVRDPDAASHYQTLPSVDAVRRFSGPGFNFNDQITGMRFTFHSPVEVVVTDPMGRRVGFDPLTQTTYNEIPNAFYDQNSADDDAENNLPDPNPRKTLELFGDVDGDYVATVTGTADGVYDMEINAIDLAGNTPLTTLDQIPTATNLVQTYTYHFERADANRAVLSGGFDGGGQRPRDVNKFLTYGNPSQSSTKLAAGTTAFTLVIFYDASVLANTFSAVLNGVDVSALFRPVAGGKEAVNLTLAAGRNVLKLSIDGQLPSRVATDTDRLVLDVP